MALKLASKEELKEIGLKSGVILLLRALINKKENESPISRKEEKVVHTRSPRTSFHADSVVLHPIPVALPNEEKASSYAHNCVVTKLFMQLIFLYRPFAGRFW